MGLYGDLHKLECEKSFNLKLMEHVKKLYQFQATHINT
jgi:hypothetical protein